MWHRKLYNFYCKALKHLTARFLCVPQPVADQLILERSNPPAYVQARDSLDEQRPLLNAKAVHLPLRLTLLAQQQPQLPIKIQEEVCAARVRQGFDADGEAGGGRWHHVGPEVDDDGPRWIEPL